MLPLLPVVLFLLLSVVPVAADSEVAVTVDVPIAVSWTDAVGINFTLALNVDLVLAAEELEEKRDPILQDKMVAVYPTTGRVNVGIASDTPFSVDGTPMTLRLTLRRAPTPEDELCKVIKLKIDEEPAHYSDAILLSGVQDGGSYNHAVSIFLNEGSAVLNGKPYQPGDVIQTEGTYHLQATDISGRVRNVMFTLDYTPPQITVIPYETTPVKGPITVCAVVNEGILQIDRHVFETNGSFTFVAVDAAGNYAQKTVTISHLYTQMKLSVQGISVPLRVTQGERLQTENWRLHVEYRDNDDTLITQQDLPVTESMLQYQTDIPGETQITVRYGEAVLTLPLIVEIKISFWDVSDDQWHAPAIYDCARKGLMAGMGPAPDGSGLPVFGPQRYMTRAELVTVLYNMEGRPEVSYAPVFHDVWQDQWYAPQIVWGYRAGVINGTSPSTFAPDAEITRQEIAAILYRYATDYLGLSISTEDEDALLGAFSDAGEVSDYARTAMAAMNQAGVITGDGDRLKPQENATRAEVASMLSRYLPNVLQADQTNG